MTTKDDCLLCGPCLEGSFQMMAENQAQWTEDFLKLFDMDIDAALSDEEREEVRQTVHNAFYCLDCLAELRTVAALYADMDSIQRQLHVIQRQCESKLSACVSQLHAQPSPRNHDPVHDFQRKEQLLKCMQLRNRALSPTSSRASSVSPTDHHQTHDHIHVIFDEGEANEEQDKSAGDETNVDEECEATKEEHALRSPPSASLFQQLIDAAEAHTRIEQEMEERVEHESPEPVHQAPSVSQVHHAHVKVQSEVEAAMVKVDVDARIECLSAEVKVERAQNGAAELNACEVLKVDVTEFMELKARFQLKDLSIRVPRLPPGLHTPHRIQRTPKNRLKKQTRNKSRAVAFDSKHCARRFVSTCDLEEHEGRCDAGERQKRQIRLPARFQKDDVSERLTGERARGNSGEEHAKKGAKRKDEKLFACSKCARKFESESALAAHVTRVHELKLERPFRCDTCGKACYSFKRWEQHRNIHDGLEPFHCPVNGCPKRFPTEVQLRSHNIQKHVPPRFQCEFCGKAFKVRGQLVHHMKSHRDVEGDDVESADGDLAKELKAGSVACPDCQRVFSTKHYLKVHKQLAHTRDFAFRCSVPACDFGATDKSVLQRHLATVHSDARPFECDLCAHNFKTQYYLNRHKKSVHPASKDFMCSDCGKCFSNKRYLQEHEEIHKDVKSFLCSLCGRYFTQRTRLNIHIRSLHGATAFSTHVKAERANSTLDHPQEMLQ